MFGPTGNPAHAASGIVPGARIRTGYGPPAQKKSLAFPEGSVNGTAMGSVATLLFQVSVTPNRNVGYSPGATPPERSSKTPCGGQMVPPRL